MLDALLPYRFSPLITVVFGLVLVVWLRGFVRRRDARAGEAATFLTGLGLCYVVLHTRFDYYAQYMFFMHRLQHLVLHHLGAFLIALAAPWATLAAGTPAPVRRLLAPILLHPLVLAGYRFLQHPVTAPILFVGLIYFWLQPGLHFDAMLDLDLYHLMNWTMLLDGLLFWWLILDPRDPATSAAPAFGTRLVMLFVIMPPQIVLGAWIALSGTEIYDVYDVCGRAWPLAPEVDQQIGGLLTWIPAAMMSVLGVIAVLVRMRRARRAADDADPDLEPAP
ncbi:MAG: cytochrome c oxidase assembly protein [Gammaproteobacteria bacterium]|nr:cytochrome c oxidase assembly protein [Gammaproteobacteria bacterium]